MVESERIYKLKGSKGTTILSHSSTIRLPLFNWDGNKIEKFVSYSYFRTKNKQAI